MAPKVLNDEEGLLADFNRMNAQLGEQGNYPAFDVSFIHFPDTHWDQDPMRWVQDALTLSSLHTMRPANWIEKNMAKDGIGSLNEPERLVAAAMEYTGSEFVEAKISFFTEWFKDLKPDGTTIRSRDQWSKWCEAHLVRHHRTAKARRFVDLLDKVGLLYDGWWQGIYEDYYEVDEEDEVDETDEVDEMHEVDEILESHNTVDQVHNFYNTAHGDHSSYAYTTLVPHSYNDDLFNLGPEDMSNNDTPDDDFDMSDEDYDMTGADDDFGAMSTSADFTNSAAKNKNASTTGSAVQPPSATAGATNESAAAANSNLAFRTNTSNTASTTQHKVAVTDQVNGSDQSNDASASSYQTLFGNSNNVDDENDKAQATLDDDDDDAGSDSSFDIDDYRPDWMKEQDAQTGYVPFNVKNNPLTPGFPPARDAWPRFAQRGRDAVKSRVQLMRERQAERMRNDEQRRRRG